MEDRREQTKSSQLLPSTGARAVTHAVTKKYRLSLTNMSMAAVWLSGGAAGECPQVKSGFGWFAMKDVSHGLQRKPAKYRVPAPKDFGQIASDLCESALQDAKKQLHPLLREAQLDRLDERPDFIKTFKRAMEHRIARKLAAWDPAVQAVFQFDETPSETWDGSIHMLVKVPRLSDTVKILGRRLDRSLVKALRQLNWPRFQKQQSILDVQQLTLNELRHGIGYGAMFSAVYTVPVKVWPKSRKEK